MDKNNVNANPHAMILKEIAAIISAAAKRPGEVIYLETSKIEVVSENHLNRAKIAAGAVAALLPMQDWRVIDYKAGMDVRLDAIGVANTGALVPWITDSKVNSGSLLSVTGNGIESYGFFGDKIPPEKIVPIVGRAECINAKMRKANRDWRVVAVVPIRADNMDRSPKMSIGEAMGLIANQIIDRANGRIRP